MSGWGRGLWFSLTVWAGSGEERRETQEHTHTQRNVPLWRPTLLKVPERFWERAQKSMPNMTGRPGYWTMEMNGGSSAPYLARTLAFPWVVHCLIRVETEGLLDYQGWAGIFSIVRWNRRPVIFGVEKMQNFYQKWLREDAKGLLIQGLLICCPSSMTSGRAERASERSLACVALLSLGHTYQSRKCAINNFWTKNPLGLLG